MNSNITKLLFKAILTLAFGAAHFAPAATIELQAVTGYWQNAADWTGGVVPGVGDYATVQGTGARWLYIQEGVNAVCARLQLASAGSGGTRTGHCIMEGGYLDVQEHLLMSSGMSANRSYFTMSGGVADILNARIGQAGRALFTQTGGEINSQSWIVGQYANSYGTNIHSGGTLNINLGKEALALGNAQKANGWYQLADDGIINLVGTKLRIGLYGAGVFEQDGGLVNSTGEVFIGEQTNSTGTAIINDGLFNFVGMYLGNHGEGYLEQNGGSITAAGSISIGGSTNGTGTLVLNDGTITLTNSMYVGNYGGGCVTQYNGSVSTRGTYVGGYNSAGTGVGKYYMYGGDHLSDSVRVGFYGNGHFEQHGGTNFVAGDGWTYVGHYDGAYGHYAMHGGLLDSPHLCIAGSSAGQFFSTGSVYLANGEIRANTEVRVGSYGPGTLTQSGGALISTNIIEIGMRTGSSGIYTQSGGSLVCREIRIGRESNAYGKYIVSGGSVSADIMRLAYGGVQNESIFSVVGTNAGIEVATTVFMGATATYEVELTRNGLTAPTCDVLTLSMYAKLIVRAAEPLPRSLHNQEIPIFYYNTLTDNKIFVPTIETGEENGTLKSAEVRYYPDHVALYIKVNQPPQGTLITIR